MAEEENKPYLTCHCSSTDMYLIEKTEEEDTSLYQKRGKPINVINMHKGPIIKGVILLCEHPYLEGLPLLDIEKTYDVKLLVANEYGDVAVSRIRNVKITSIVDREKDRPIYEYTAESYEPWKTVMWRDQK
jgi:hypothetical protein